MKPGMERVAFRPRELEMLQDLDGDERQNWTLRLWCAKEAAAKAVALAAGPVSESIGIEAIDRGAGTVLVRFTSPAGGDLDLSASTFRDGDWIAATCVR
jgi:phosphopantetheinyl transferase (holo-ACP synthase)